MADQTTNFEAKADTSDLDKLSKSMRNLTNDSEKLAKAFASVNTINDNTTKSSIELIERIGGLESEYAKFAASTAKASEEQRKLQVELEKTKAEAKDITLKAEGTGGIGPPPIIPPRHTGSPEDEPGKRAEELAARAAAINRIIAQLGIDISKLDGSGFERLRSKVNALAQAAGLGQIGLERLSEAFGVLNDRSLEPTSTKVAIVINRLQDLAKIAREAAQVEVDAADKRATSFQKASEVGERAEEKQRILDAKIADREQKAADRQARIAQAPIATGAAVAAIGGTPDVLAGLRPEDAAKVRTEIDRINQAFASNKATVADAEAAINRLNTGSFEPLSAGAKAVYTNLSRINDILKEQAGIAQRSVEANQKIKDALTGIGISESKIAGLDPGRAQTARVSINNLTAAFISGKISADDLNLAVQALNTKGIVPLTGGAAAAAAQLGQLKTVTSDPTGLNPLIAGFNRLSFQITNIAQRRLIFGIINEFKSLFAESSKFETDLTRIGVIANLSTEQVDKLGIRIRNLSVEFGRTNVDIANAGIELFRNKTFTTAQAQDTLNDALKLGRATFADTATAAKAISDSLGLFGLKASDAHRTASLLFAGVTAGGADLKDVTSLLDTTGLAAKQLGLSIEDILAAFVSLRNSGLPAQRSVQTLSTLFNTLIRDSGGLTEILGKKFSSAAEAVKALGLQETLKLISEASKTGSGRMKEFADAILGADPNISKINASITELTETQKRFGDVSEQVGRTFEERLNRARETGKSFGAGIVLVIKAIDVALAEGSLKVIDYVSGYKVPPGIEETKRKLEELKNKQDEVSKAADKSNDDTLKSYRKLFSTIEENAFSTLLTLRNQFQNNSLIVEENFKNLSELVKKITADANSNIKSAQKEIESFAQNIAKRSFDKRIEILPPQQQFVELQARFNDLIKAGQAFAAAGNLQESKRSFQEAADILVKFESINNRLATQQGQTAKATDRNFQNHLLNLDKILGKTDKLDSENIKFSQRQIEALTKFAKAYDNPFLRANALNEVEARRLALIQREALEKFQIDQASLRGTAQDTEKKVQKDRVDTEKQINDLIAQQKKLREEANAQTEFRSKIPSGIARDLEELNTITGNFNKGVPEAQKALTDFINQPSPTNLKEVNKTLEFLINDLEKVRERGTSTFEVEDTVPVIDRLKAQLANLNAAPVPTTQLDVVTKQLEALKAGAPDAAVGISNAFNAASLSSKDLTTNIVNFNTALDASIDRLDGILRRIRAIGQGSLNAPEIDGGAGGSFASGGLISGPHGNDNLLIRAQNGEFVSTREATRAFYPQLVAMNSLRGFQHGGMVTNNNSSVGNINVSINAQNTEQGNIRNIGQAIARELRRGTLRF